MPIYEFACTGCGHLVEVRASLTQKDAGLAPSCPACGSDKLRRTFSTVALVGSGSATARQAPSTGGGCCGGACGCG